MGKAVRKTEAETVDEAQPSARERSRMHGLVKRRLPDTGLTRERFDSGVWDSAAVQHADGKGGIRETMALRDLSAMAGGAGLLFFRGSISREQFLAASWIRRKAETAFATGQSVTLVREKVDGGAPSDGMMSLRAAFDSLALEGALAGLGETERAVVRATVLGGLDIGQVADTVAGEWTPLTRLKTRRQKVLAVLVPGLDKVAVYAAWRNWG